MDFSEKADQGDSETGKRQTQLRQWPIQLHLVSPQAPYFQEKDVMLVADCVPFAYADFHKDFLKGKSLAIGCPKLDSEQEIYVDKIQALIDDSKINTLTVQIMQVPCCSGLVQVAKAGADKATRKIPVKQVVVGLEGDILSEDWI
ncbi:MAG: 4Fe-4S ferredoxin [Planctomycetes bacterium]|nr:4Fe-4S ferredoxin [Planctomycetota bacterium]